MKEADLTTVTLTPEAAKRLGIATVAVEKKRVSGTSGSTAGKSRCRSPSGRAANALMALAPPQNATEMLKLAELQAAADGELRKQG